MVYTQQVPKSAFDNGASIMLYLIMAFLRQFMFSHSTSNDSVSNTYTSGSM